MCACVSCPLPNNQSFYRHQRGICDCNDEKGSWANKVVARPKLGCIMCVRVPMCMCVCVCVCVRVHVCMCVRVKQERCQASM